MSNRAMIGASVLVVATMAAIAAVALARLPAGATLPVHWNAAGEADGFAGAGSALFMPVALAAGLSALLAAIPRLEPMQEKLEGSAPLLRASWAGMLFVLALVELMVAGPAFGLQIPASALLVGVGLLLVLVGNALPQSRPGFFVGIRTPWTITDPDNWIATHRYASWFFIGAGALIVAVGVLPIDAEARSGLVIAALLVATVTPVLYSYLRWRRTR